MQLKSLIAISGKANVPCISAEHFRPLDDFDHDRPPIIAC
jgi:hypothetical protein